MRAQPMGERFPFSTAYPGVRSSPIPRSANAVAHIDTTRKDDSAWKDLVPSSVTPCGPNAG